MAKGKRPETTANAPSENDHVRQLTSAVLDLADQVRILTAAIDDIRQELEWTVKCLRVSPSQVTYSAPTPITSISQSQDTAANQARDANDESLNHGSLF